MLTREEKIINIWTHHFSQIILIAVCFHVPNDLMAEMLGDFSGLKDETFDIA
jgi:hypothetical protein